MEKHLCASGFKIEGTGREEESLAGNEDKEGEWGNWTAADWQQDCETLHGSTPLEEEGGEVHLARELRCLYTNANSVINEMDELRDRILINDLHIIAITETWAREEIIESELNAEGYALYRKDRKSETHCKGGGIMILVKALLKSKPFIETE